MIPFSVSGQTCVGSLISRHALRLDGKHVHPDQVFGNIDQIGLAPGMERYTAPPYPRLLVPGAQESVAVSGAGT